MTSPGILRPVVGGVARRISSASGGPLEKLQRVQADLPREAADFVDRVCQRHGAKVVAGEVDRGYTAVRGWTSTPDHIPLLALPTLCRLADPSDPFVHRLAALLGFRLVPVEESPETIASAIVDSCGLSKKKERGIAAILRGYRNERDSRQGRLWEGE